MENWEKNIAALILNYNSAALTLENVQKLRNLYRTIEIIIVDNNSSDNSVELFKKTFQSESHIWIIDNKENKGYAAGNNAGLRYIASHFPNVKYTVIMNPDVLIEDRETLKKMSETLSYYRNLAIISTQIIFNGHIRQLADCGWQKPNKKYLLFGGTLLGRILAPRTNMYYNELIVDERKVAYLDVVPGCFFMAKMSILDEVNYMDEHTFIYQEENILSKKIQSKGYGEGVLMNCFVHHNHMTRDEQLTNWRNKLYDRKCFYESKKYYVLNYSDESMQFKYLCLIFMGIDYNLKKLAMNTLYLLTSLIKNVEKRPIRKVV